MSVMMGLRIAVDVAAFEQMAAENQETLKAVEARSKEMGAIHHRFYGNVDGSEVLVVDEWPDPESFVAFMHASPEIPEMFGKAGVTAEPQPVFWRELDAGDAF